MEETQALLNHKRSKTSLVSLICKVLVAIAILSLICYFGGKQERVQQTFSESTTTATTNDQEIVAQRILIYYSPNEDDSNDLDLIDLINEENMNPITNKPYITHIEISTLHLKQYDQNTYIHLNDLSPNNARFDKLRENIVKLQEYDVKVLFMMGGWEGIDGKAPNSDSSFVNLFNEWDTFYPKLIQLIKEWNVDGLDIDIENCYDDDYNLINDNYENMVKLIVALKQDFGDSFIISLSPVAEAIFANDKYGGLSGFNYKSLIDSKYGELVNGLNLQFYNGWGNLDNIKQYEQCINQQGYQSNKLVAGMLDTIESESKDIEYTINILSSQFGDNFGGVFVWNGNDIHTIKWSKYVYKLMHKGE